jgi:ADP-ribose pyrophosphatase YjhB (NUDIX family)
MFTRYARLHAGRGVNAVPVALIPVGQSPRAACRREVAEELGLDRPPGRVLAVDWVPARTIGPDQTLLPDRMTIVFDGARGTAGTRGSGPGPGGPPIDPEIIP